MTAYIAIGIVLLVVGSLILIPYFYTVYINRKLKKYQKITGNVVDINILPDNRSGISPYCDLIIEFYFNGTPYSRTLRYCLEKQVLIGDKIDIYFDWHSDDLRLAELYPSTVSVLNILIIGVSLILLSIATVVMGIVRFDVLGSPVCIKVLCILTGILFVSDK